MGRVLGWSSRRTAVALGLLLLAIYLPTATWDVVQVTDTRSTMMAAWGLGTTGSVALPEAWQDLPWRAVTTDGTVVSNRLPGATVWGALFYGALPVATEVGHAHDVPAWPAAIASATCAALAMAVLFLALDRLVDDRRLSLGGTLVFALGTSTWAVSSDALWTHGPAQLGIALALLALAHDRHWLAGLALGWAMFSRPQVGAAAAVIGLGLGWSGRSPLPVARVGLGALPGFVGIIGWSRLLFDTWRPGAGYSYAPTSLAAPANRLVGTGGGEVALLRLVPVLVHPLRGVLVFSPWLLVCLPGVRAGWRQAPPWVRWSALGGLAAMLLQLAVQPAWHGGDDHFGYRLPLEWLTLSAPLLLLAWREWASRRHVARVATALLVGAAVVLQAAGSTFMDPRADRRAAFLQMVDDLGPNGEGFDPGTAVGPDRSRPD